MAHTHLYAALGEDYVPPASRDRYRVFTAEQLIQLRPPPPLIDGIMALRSFVCLYGAPGVAKTFVALHLALSVAMGRECFGRTVRKGPVWFIAGEGAEGLNVRLRVWKLAMGVERIENVTFLPEAVNLLKEEAVEKLIAQLEDLPRRERPSLLVIDTLARCMVGGDENSARDVGIAIAALDQIRIRIGCTILVLHHTAKHSHTERGSGALRGAADTMMSLRESDKNGGGLYLRCDKQKNAARFRRLHLDLKVVDLGEIEDSCVLELLGNKNALLPNRKRVLDILRRAKEGRSFSELLDRTEQASSTLKRGLQFLIEGGYVRRPKVSRGGAYTITELGRLTVESAGKKPKVRPKDD